MECRCTRLASFSIFIVASRLHQQQFAVEAIWENSKSTRRRRVKKRETKANCLPTLLSGWKASGCSLFGFTLHKAPFFIFILNGRTAITFKNLIQLLQIVSGIIPKGEEAHWNAEEVNLFAREHAKDSDQSRRRPTATLENEKVLKWRFLETSNTRGVP